jgi:tetratricopeptide (TPR) repeat protein
MSFGLKNIKRTLLSLLCIVHLVLCIDLSAHEEYADSMFRAQIAKEQLTDSTLYDQLFYNLFKAKEYQLKGQINEAVNQLVSNIELDTNILHPELYATSSFQLYRILYDAKQYSEAFHFIKLAHHYNPENNTYLRDLAWMEYGFQQYKLAIQHFQELNKRLPYNSDNIYSLCQIYLQDKQYNKALKELEKYQFLEGNSVQILAQRAAIHEQSGKPQKAEKEILNYINNNPEDKLDASLLLSRIYLKNGRNTESLNLLLKLNNEYPDNGTILTSLADHYKNIDNDSLYEKYSLDAVKSATFNASTAVKIIRPILSGYVQNTDTTNIQPILNTLNQIYPNESPIIELHADVYKALKDTTNWRSALYELQKIRNNDKVLDFQLVTLAESLHDNKEIYRLTKEGYDKYGDDTWAYYYIISLTKNDMTDSIVSESNRLLPLITTSNIKSRIYQIVGDTYSSQSQDTLAMAMYDSCLVYDPNNSGALNNVAYNITKQPNPDLKRAEKMAARALELDPESIYILDTYAWILFLQGDNFLSEFYFDKLLRIEKEQNIEPSIETLYHIGCLYLKTNRLEQAKEMWHKALNIYNENPDNFNEKEIINIIQNFFNDNENK